MGRWGEATLLWRPEVCPRVEDGHLWVPPVSRGAQSKGNPSLGMETSPQDGAIVGKAPDQLLPVLGPPTVHTLGPSSWC